MRSLGRRDSIERVAGLARAPVRVATSSSTGAMIDDLVFASPRGVANEIASHGFDGCQRRRA
ncbi:MAG: hypothetical protein U0610_14275 [bacterium]